MSATLPMDEALSERQKAVLDAALSLLVEDGDKLTMTAVARRASCSKETLYKWFGGRDGLLTATVQWQAAKVRAVPVRRETLCPQSLVQGLEQFASDWLRVIASRTSIALNRVAVGQAGTDKHDLGLIVLENGPVALRARLRPFLEVAREAGLLEFDTADEAFGTFFGLVVRDLQIRLLLGDRTPITDAEIDRDARRATQQFLSLHGAQSTAPATAPATSNNERGNVHARVL
ncbi:TetR/AcrR family transcriptional regulator [Aureimonas ureilytica]|uniref:TetR/AcrR family transcriptional regulator n=1 Tax=Aureimonas ureilytica TaxID=401562 RepID=UPI0006862799|nr:TetR/AcrR family transcriptional regulator [Aureimonas ureilytica]